MSRSAPLGFSSADGVALDARLRLPDGPPRGVALVCHPHPEFGGHMDVWLLPTVAEHLAAEGWATLRFNFRGVGRGGRVSPDGADEVADLAAASELAYAWAPGAARCAVVGWSFGALIGLHHGRADPRVTDWVGIAPPTGPAPGVHLPPLPVDLEGWGACRTAIVGECDQYFPPDAVGVLAPDTVHVLADADHFLYDRDEEVATLVARALS